MSVDSVNAPAVTRRRSRVAFFGDVHPLTVTFGIFWTPSDIRILVVEVSNAFVKLSTSGINSKLLIACRSRVSPMVKHSKSKYYGSICGEFECFDIFSGCGKSYSLLRSTIIFKKWSKF